MNNKIEFRLIVTLGPAILNKDALRKISAEGPCIFRINGSHNSTREGVKNIVEEVRGILPTAVLWLDLPGNKIRTADLKESIVFKKGQLFDIFSLQVNYGKFIELLKVGDELFANDSTYIFEVEKLHEDRISLMPFCDGVLTKNKGLHLPGIYGKLPFLFEKDLELIKAATENKIDHLALSYVRNREDIQDVRAKLNNNNHVNLVAKVETLPAVQNLADIMEEVDHLLVDRGDLSCDVGMINVPRFQESIICAAKNKQKKIFLATQFLKNMERNPIPSIAEEIDLFRTIKSGIHGIQLSEETAIGLYPQECVERVFEVYRNIISLEKAHPYHDDPHWKNVLTAEGVV